MSLPSSVSLRGMGQIVIGTFMTVDGVMQAPGGPDEDRDGGFEHGGWSFPYWDDEMGEVALKAHQRADSLLFGRKSYEILGGYWPNQPDDDPMAAKLNAVPKYVASRTRPELAWQPASFVDDFAKLKEEVAGVIFVIGSSNLCQTLIGEGHVDRYELWTFPVVLGTGKRLFETPPPHALRHVDGRPFDTGVVRNVYEPAGEVVTGSF